MDVPAPHRLLGPLLLLLAQAFGGAFATTCPKDALGAVHACVGIKKEFDGGGSGLLSDTNKMKQICKDRTLDNAIKCLEQVIGACASETTLEQTINARKWKWGLQTLCANLPGVDNSLRAFLSAELLRSEGCLLRTQPIMEECADNQTESYNTEVRRRVLDGNHDPDVIMKLSCEYTDNIINCIRRPMSEYCRPRIVNIMMRVVRSFIPPACEHGDEGYYTDGHDEGHVTSALTPLVLSCTSCIIAFTLFLRV